MFNEIKGERNQVVAHYKDHTLLRGYTHDFTPMKETFHLTSEREEDRGKIYEVRTADLKALFFVKSLEGNIFYKEKKKFEEVDTSALRGLKVKVEFDDGEIIRGISLGYSKKKSGFFIIPVDPHSNNERIYVVADSVRDVKVGNEAEN